MKKVEFNFNYKTTIYFFPGRSDDLFIDENIYRRADSAQVLREPRSEDLEETEDQS